MSKPLSRLIFLMSCLLFPALAGAGDPLSAAVMAPLRPSPQLAARVGALPCADALPDTPLQAIDAVDLALCNNPQTRELWASARAQAALVGVARSAWLPDLDGRLGTGRVFAESGDNNQRSAALNLSWLLYDFGQRSANVESAVQLLNVAAATQDAGVQSIFLAALQNYYAAQATRALVSSTLQAERSARESFNAAEVRYQVGTGTPAERLQAQTALSQATLNRIRAEGEARNALGSLANALGFGAPTPVALADLPALPEQTAFAADVARLIAEAQAQRPDLRAAEAQIRAAEAGIEVARAQGRPSLALAAGPLWQSVGGVETHGGSLGLTLNVPLFTGFETHYRVRSAAAQAELRVAQRDRLKNQVALDVWRAWQSLTTATQSLATTSDLLASATQSERVALGRYKAGVGNVLDLLAAQSALAAARVQRIQAVLDWNVYRATLAQAMGALDYSLLQGSAQGKP